jgi:outer membrane protein TolC
MNRLLILLIIPALFLVNQSKAQNEQHSMSLQEAVEYALVHNQNILNAQLDIVAAEGFVKENFASGLPQINGGINLADNFELPTSFLPAEIIGGPPGESVPIQFGTKYSGNATISARQMVFDGVFFVGLEAAKTFQELSTKNHIKTKIDVVENVTKAYYSVLVSKLTLELIEKNYGRLDTLLNDTKAMYKSGFAERIDVSRVQVPFNNIKVTKENSRKMLVVAESLLKFQMGLPVEDQITLTDELSLEMFKDATEEEFDYDQRIEYSILQTSERLALLDIKRTKVAYIPTLDLYANIGAVAGTGAGANLFNLGNEWFSFGLVGLQMNIPIFDGLRKRSSIQQKEVKLSQVHNSFELLKNGIDLEIQQSQIAYSNSVDFMNVQLENMKISEDVYNVTKIKYQGGVGSNIELINADAEYKEAQTNFFTALYSALVAKVDYNKALGKLD